jgi:hypothetical protein
MLQWKDFACKGIREMLTNIDYGTILKQSNRAEWLGNYFYELRVTEIITRCLFLIGKSIYYVNVMIATSM